MDYTVPQSLEVWVGGNRVKPNVAKSRDSEKVLASLGKKCGDHVFFYESTKLNFVLTGEDDCIVEIKQIKTVVLTLKIEMDLDTFYDTDGPMLFIDKMAAFLGIPNDKLRIVSIIKGSVIINYEVVDFDQMRLESPKFKNLTDHKVANDTCGGSGISDGILDGLSSGELDFGGKVSKMSYSCHKTIDDNAEFTKAEEETKKGERKPKEVIVKYTPPTKPIEKNGTTTIG